jgi:L-iditol 2-dehydrogenase
MMQAAVYEANRGLSVQEVPTPHLRPGELLVRVRAASLCGTDLKILRHGHFKIPPGSSRVLGHELAGDVLETRAPAAALPVGARVGVVPNLGCGRCDRCACGEDHLCPDYEALGITLDGGLAEYVRIPAAAVARGHVVPLPDGVSYEEAALVEPMSCVFNAHEAVQTGRGDRVLIFGAGPMGLMHLLMARLRGASRVVVADPLPERRQRAEGFGADAAIAPGQVREITGPQGRQGFDVVIVTAARPEAQQQAIEAAAVRGRVNFFAGLPAGEPPPALDTNAVHYRQLLVTGTTGASARQYRHTLELVGTARLDLRRLVSRRAPLHDLDDVVSAVADGKELKVVLHPGGAEGVREAGRAATTDRRSG